MDKETDYDYSGQVFSNPYAGTATTSDVEFTAGIQAGYNWAISDRIVAGFEVNYGLADASYKATDVRPAGGGIVPAFSVEHKLTTMGAVRGRLGYSVRDALIFATGGFAFGKHENDIIVQPGNRNNSYRQDVTGWTIGAGFAYKLTDSISLQSEYSYTDFGTDELYSRIYTRLAPASARLTAKGDRPRIRSSLGR